MLCPVCNAKTEVTTSTLCDVAPSLSGQKRFYPVGGMIARIRECECGSKLHTIETIIKIEPSKKETTHE